MSARMGAVLLVIAVAGCAGTRAGDPGALPPETRRIPALRAAVPPVLDGKLDDACWQKAETVTSFKQINSDRAAAWQSFGYVAYDDAHIYIGVKCLMPEGTKPRGKVREHDGNVFSDEVVEIMLDPGLTRSDYYQLAVNAYGATFDCSRLHGGAHEDDSWNGDWTAKTHIADGYWSVEAAIPFHNLGISPDMGPEWGINLCREGKTPGEMSAIAENGAFNNAGKFAVLTNLNVDFRKYFVQIGPGAAVMEPTADAPAATFTMPVTNRTGRRRKIEIAAHRTGPDGNEEITAQVVELKNRESITLRLEKLRMAPLFDGRTDLYLIEAKPATTKIVVSDAANETVLSLLNVKRLTMCEAMRIDVDDPWNRATSSEMTDAITLKVHTRLPRAEMKAGVLDVSILAAGKVVASRQFTGPGETTPCEFDTKDLAWGAYEVVATFHAEGGREVVRAKAAASVLPGEPYHIVPLNNFAGELVNARERGQLGDREIVFMNPRDGWCFFSLSGTAIVTLDDGGRPLLVPTLGKKKRKPAEVMRRLKAGRHSLRILGKPDQIIVRSVPALLYYAFPTTPGVSAMGPYDWDNLKDTVLPHCNVIVGSSGAEPAPEWLAQGRKWIVNATVPGTHDAGDVVPAEELYKHWSASPGFQRPDTSGVIADEFASTRADQYLAWTLALRWLATNPNFRDRTFFPWCSQVFGSDATRTFMRTTVEAGWPYAFYDYLIEQDTEEKARELIRDSVIRAAKSCNEETFTSARDAIVTMGYMSHPGESQNGNPNVDFKVLMEMQMEALANDPDLFGIHGLLWYSAHYCDEENLRWAARLFRHYAIEGRKERLSDAPYLTAHIRNGDFDEALDGWTVEAAEEGSVRPDRMKGYGVLQGRYVTKRGDTLLVMKRSAKAPNRITQTINGLVPGRTYSIKMISADFRNLSEEKSVKKRDGIVIDLQNVNLVPGAHRNFQCTYENHPGHRMGKFAGAYHAYMNYHWYAFRAKAPTATLTISDWTLDGRPGGTIGKETMLNFIEVQPYFLSE